MTAEGTINYEALAQDAMRGVVRAVLKRTAKSGLPGEHHFYISFDTQQAGVSMSRRLKEKYPEEMTIVLQHRFWDLSVTDERFEVKLTFDGIPERLVIPFHAIKVFFDPSVRYGLQFDEVDFAGTATQGIEQPLESGGSQDTTARPPGNQRPGVTTSVSGRKRPGRKARPERADGGEARETETDPAAPAAGLLRSEDAGAARRGPVPLKPVAEAGAKPAAALPASGAQIVSLSDFRKK